MNKTKRPRGRPKDSSHPEGSVKMTSYVDPVNKRWLEAQVKKKVFRSASHGVDYCLTIMKTVFDSREEQISQLAQSGQMGLIVNNVDEVITEGQDGEQPGPENPEG